MTYDFKINIDSINYFGRNLLNHHTYEKVVECLFGYVRQEWPITIIGIDIYRSKEDIEYYVRLESGNNVTQGFRKANPSHPSTQCYLLEKPLRAPISEGRDGASETKNAAESLYLPLHNIKNNCFAVLWIVGEEVYSQEAEQALSLMGNYVSIAVSQQEDLKVRNDVMNEAAIVSVTDLKGNILEINDRFCEVSKFTREELIGKNQNIVNSGYHSKELWKEVWATIGRGHIWRGEVRNRAKDGSIYWVDAVIAPFIGTNGRPYQYFSLRFDITKRKEMEAQMMEQTQELASSEEEMRQQNEEVMAINNNLETLLRSEREKTLELAVRDQAMNEAAIVSITDLKGNILEVNDRFCKVSKHRREDLIGQNQSIVGSGHHDKAFWKEMWATIGRGNKWRGEIRNQTKDGKPYWVDTTIVPFIDEQGRPYKYFSLRIEVTQQKLNEQVILMQQEELKTSNEELKATNDQLALLNEELKESREKITSSINYAQRIQEALLPSPKDLSRVLGEKKYFVNLYPRDIVSGDFYWATRVGDISIVALSDCTGHGVPGAFMSAIGISQLEKTVMAEHQTDPARILQQMNAQIEKMLHQNGELSHRSRRTMDGMDIAILKIDWNSQEITYAGAKQPLYLSMPNEHIEVIKGTTLSVGGNLVSKENEFETHTIPIVSGMQVYFSSDGYTDQFDLSNKKKFSKRRFIMLLESIRHYEMDRQSDEIDQALMRWKGDSSQLDDISVLGIRF